MAIEENKDTERRLALLEEATRNQKSASEMDLGDRLSVLEEKLKNEGKDRYDVYFKTFVWASSLVLALLGYFHFDARNETEKAIQRMEKSTDKAIGEMKSDVARLIGDANKKPVIEILYDGTPLDGQTVEMSYNDSQNLEFVKIFLKNVGDKKADQLSVAAYLTIKGRLWDQNPWETIQSLDKKFLTATTLKTQGFWIAPQQPLNLPPLYFRPESSDGSMVHTNFSGKIVVYFGGDGVVQANFQVKIIP